MLLVSSIFRNFGHRHRMFIHGAPTVSSTPCFTRLRLSSSAVPGSYEEEEDGDASQDVAPLARGELPKIRERKVDEKGRSYGTGRRKTSIARVWISEGCGQITVNDKNFCDYFTQTPREHVLEAFVTSKTAGFFDVRCTAQGGGPMGNIRNG